MLRWEYEADIRWLEARKLYLTATDVVALLPELKRVRKSGLKTSNWGEYSLECAKLWAEKTGTEELDTQAPSQAAARGHVMEPFAIQEFSRLAETQMYPWDDVLIADDESKLAFSPDALSIPCPISGLCLLPSSGFTEGEWLVKGCLEIKSYSCRKHMEKLLEDKMASQERYQIAVAMAVIPTIELGAVMFFNPSCAKAIGVKVYKREDLEQELKDVAEVSAMYNTTAETMEKFDGFFETTFTEQSIYEAAIAARDENPLMI